MRRSAVISCLIALCASAACSEDKGTCETHSDCFEGELCSVDGHCVHLPDMGTSDSGHGSEDGGDDMSTPGDFGGDIDVTGDTGRGDVAPDVSDSTDGGTDADVASDASMLACQVDPFDHTCTDDEHETNNEVIDSKQIIADKIECVGSQLSDVDLTISGTMCARDGEDWFDFTYVPCDDFDYIIEYVFENKTMCRDEWIGFDVKGVDCADANVSCNTTMDGHPRIRFIVEKSFSPVEEIQYIQVHNAERNDVLFEYDFRVRTVK